MEFVRKECDRRMIDGWTIGSVVDQENSISIMKYIFNGYFKIMELDKKKGHL